MAKEARITFEGEGEELVMVQKFPAIGKTLRHPVGVWFERLAEQGFCHGMKQRFSDLGALPKELSDREKDLEHFERAEALSEHLSAGGDWKIDSSQTALTAFVAMGKDSYFNP